MKTGIFGIGQWEVVVILVVLFILFGHRLPSAMRSLGRSVIEIRMHQGNPDHQWAILVCLFFLAFLIGVLAMTLIGLFAAQLS